MHPTLRSLGKIINLQTLVVTNFAVLPTYLCLAYPDSRPSSRQVVRSKIQTNSRPSSAGAFRIDACTLTSPREARIVS